MEIKGLDLDSAGRCRHYHTSCDIVALKCATCQHYYACYHCHDSLENHHFQASNVTSGKPILCGNCMTYLDFIDYQTGSCPNCHHPFNPNCKAHYSIYFKGV
ncbi:CHY zinc finger protein [Streptococcus hillyeri]|uniref:CHY-type domain-containing protein n=1 Tax=Streptococcus hillyeri TaxID=2282420 RepID=A0A3L9DVI7_9STRE|nr:CHY zinc finger protein [Streptococcus hillyeri]RLY03749.1 hypothetical protein EAF07_04240 [Streptococcus hillyeri]